MNVKSFLKVVEIQTKVASIIPYLVGVLFALYHYQEFNGINSILFLISLLGIDMATTAINNYMDHKKAVVKVGYNYEEHNGIVSNNLSDKQVLITIITLIVIGTIAGLLLVLRTDLIVLVIGFFSFGIGIIYSAGPIPISRTPFGEIFSGLMMGGVIFFISIYIQLESVDLISYEFLKNRFTVSLDFVELIYIVIIAVPLVAGISNIMLANNICDLEEDIKNNRYTLPCFIGENKALFVFRALYYSSYLSVILALILGILPLTSLLIILTFPVINSKINHFVKIHIKEETFILSVQSFMLFGLFYALSIFIGLFIFVR